MADNEEDQFKSMEMSLEWNDGDFCVFRPVSTSHVTPGDALYLEDSLQIVLSSLPGPEEAKLFRQFLVLKIKHWTLQPDCGVVSSFHSGLSKPAQLYTCLINISTTTTTTTSTDNNGTDDGSESTDDKLLICLLSTREFGLEMFREDLDDFVNKLKPSLRTLQITDNDTVINDTDIYKLIKSWTNELTYLTRIVEKYHSQLPFLLHVGLHNTVKITGDNQNNIDELYRFINSCNVSVLMNSTQSQSLLIDIGTDDNESNAVNISLNGDTIHISTDETNEFCIKWAKDLTVRGVSDVDSFFLKKVNEAYKLKIIQDMNSFKRLIRDAETNYYSLYKCYTFLQFTGNVDLLLKCSMNEAVSQRERETEAIVNVLMDFIQRKKNKT